MNEYRIEVDYATFDAALAISEPDGWIPLTGTLTQHAATREQAVYNLFDALADDGYEIIAIGNVYLIDQGVPTLIQPHRREAASNV